MKKLYLVLYVIFALLIGGTYAKATSMNGFVLDDALIPEDELLFDGPPKDGIPSLDNPKVINAAQARLHHEGQELALKHKAIVKAYPLRILSWYEIVNDHKEYYLLLVMRLWHGL